MEGWALLFRLGFTEIVVVSTLCRTLVVRPQSYSFPKDGQFYSTRWSLVLRAGDLDDSEASQRALEHLCQAYWYPLYAYVRRSGHSLEDAQDLTQGFFAHLLEKAALSQVVPDRGRFRSFLLRSMKNYITSEWRREHAQKRGGATEVLSLNADDAERRYQVEPTSGELSAEVLYDRRWARALLEQVFKQLREEYREAGKEDRFEALREHLLDRGQVDYTAQAAKLNLSVSGVRTQVHRMRSRFLELMRSEIAETVAEPSEVNDELRYLLQVLG